LGKIKKKVWEFLRNNFCKTFWKQEHGGSFWIFFKDFLKLEFLKILIFLEINRRNENGENFRNFWKSVKLLIFLLNYRENQIIFILHTPKEKISNFTKTCTNFENFSPFNPFCLFPKFFIFFGNSGFKNTFEKISKTSNNFSAFKKNILQSGV